MLTFKIDDARGVVTVEPQDQLEASDFDELSQAVDAYIAEKGDLQGVLIHAKQFPGWKNFAGLVAHIGFVRDHVEHIRRVALVSDSDIASLAPKIADAFASAEVRHFPDEKLARARQWVEGDDGDDDDQS